MQHKIRMLAMAIVVGLLAAATGSPVQAAPSGKPQAPVEITATVQAKRATLKLTFESAAEQVTVRVYGVDGLTVSGTKTPVIAGTFAAGQVMTLTVGYKPGAGTSNLAVQVDGRFEGGRRTKTSSFTVNDGQAAQLISQPANIGVDGLGRRIVILPAESK